MDVSEDLFKTRGGRTKVRAKTVCNISPPKQMFNFEIVQTWSLKNIVRSLGDVQKNHVLTFFYITFPICSKNHIRLLNP